MGIYIPGIDMPDSCDNCFICNRCEGNCDISDADYLPNKRPDDCPLVELPPHGRLIDADALMLRVDCHGTNKFGMLDEDIREFIGCAPTIIPADPEGGADE